MDALILVGWRRDNEDWDLHRHFARYFILGKSKHSKQAVKTNTLCIRTKMHHLPVRIPPRLQAGSTGTQLTASGRSRSDVSTEALYVCLDDVQTNNLKSKMDVSCVH